MNKPKKQAPGPIAQNRKARHDYHFEEKFEAGVVLEGWEVKSLRAGKVQIVDSFVLIRDGEAFLHGVNITPLSSASTHVIADPKRVRKLLLHEKELSSLVTATHQKGYTCIATSLYWKGNRIKCEIALARGKKQHDKRASEKERDWKKEQGRYLKRSA